MSKCKWCGEVTEIDTAPECNFCWEVRTRAEIRPTVVRKLADTLCKDPDKIAISWCTDDVLGCAKNRGLKCTKAQAREVLSFIKHKHDANTGINWDVIACAIHEKVWEA